MPEGVRRLEQKVITRKEERWLPVGVLKAEYASDGAVEEIDGVLHVTAERVLTETIQTVSREEWYRSQCALACGCGAC